MIFYDRIQLFDLMCVSQLLSGNNGLLVQMSVTTVLLVY